MTTIQATDFQPLKQEEKRSNLFSLHICSCLKVDKHPGRSLALPPDEQSRQEAAEHRHGVREAAAVPSGAVIALQQRRIAIFCPAVGRLVAAY